MPNINIENAIIKAASNANINLQINDSTMLATLKSLNIDSLSVMGIIVNVEKELGVQLDDEDLQKLKTLGDLVAAFKKKCSA
ncbi:MAG: phosphopantetheine-binding protein [Mycoplasmataceae bacterium]|jgi:acyl carrier protein|nr:phosphopantetheine-binding protein [Mycoplasmataceae bacterium]